jgi:lysylphosphatidylglycerol synthetase-like protein (DUF2156 family)
MSAQHPHGHQPRYKRWAAWTLVVLLVPLGAASIGFIYALYLALVTGSLTTVAKGFRATSTTVRLAESPIWFSVFFVLTAAFAAVFIIGTVVLARLAYRHLRSGSGKQPP